MNNINEAINQVDLEWSFYLFSVLMESQFALYRAEKNEAKQCSTDLQHSSWEDIQSMTEGSVFKTYLENSLPGGPSERAGEYKAPYFRPDWEVDYRVAWEIFSARLEGVEL